MRGIKFNLIIGLTLIIVIYQVLSSCDSSSSSVTFENMPQRQSSTAHGMRIDTVPAVHRFGSNNCTGCHAGIEHIRQENTGMMQAILQVADNAGHPGNDCIICHGGNPNTKNKELAHSGTIDYFKNQMGPKEYYPDPGSPWINEHTCGMCHQEQVSTQFTSLMFTEAGKIQGTLWGFGGMNRYQHDIGNYETKEREVHEILGTETYRKYIAQLKNAEPQVFPQEMTPLPPAPTAEEVQENPQLSVYTYLRQECLRCHTGNQGRNKRGDYRGMGCSACHMPYSNEGFYEGQDSIINKEKAGKVLVHSMQGSRKTKVNVHGQHYSGIPVETCTSCHDRGKRIGTSYQGLMETAYSSPFMGDGEEQPKLHTKHYLHLHADVHLDKGMLCQDCHTSGDVHSDGTLSGTTLAPVEIECQDCHGTVEKYPWELPIGFSDEVLGFDKVGDSARGTTTQLLDHMKQGTVYEPEDGYLISARGNPIPNLVKHGNTTTLYTAGGKDIELKPLKYLADNNLLSIEGEVAMKCVTKHMETMECYSCHATWAPQCYGCHIKIDYSEGNQHPDWLAMGAAHDKHGMTAEGRDAIDSFMIDGKVSEQRSYLRWEDPPLVVNGENRVSPGIPGCQTSVTVVGKDGTALLKNHIFKIPNSEGAGDEGQLGIDISPVQPHTIQKASRSCEGCHSNPQAMGYGIEGGSLFEDPSKPYVVELSTADGKVLPKKYKTQIDSIPNLNMDWSRFVTETGKQLQTVGHHYSGSRPLNNEERKNLDRRGVCLACHEQIPSGDVAIDLLSHVKEVTDLREIDTGEHNDLIGKSNRIAAWAQVIGAFVLGVLLVLLVLRIKNRKWN